MSFVLGVRSGLSKRWLVLLRGHLFHLLAGALVVFVMLYPYRSGYWAYLLLAAALWGVGAEQQGQAWSRFLPVGLPLLLFPILLWRYFPPVWNKVVYWQLGAKPHLFELDALFKMIPLNSGWLFRLVQTPWLTAYFRWIYANGFTLPVLIPVIRSFFARDSLKMVRYSLSAHVLQFFLIFPLYLTVQAREVWYVLGEPDGMARHLSPLDAAVVVINCFPSMHTSVAFAMFLLAWREKDKAFRWTWSIFCLSVIYSTLYLEIHWLADVAGGLLLGWIAVKLGDKACRIMGNRVPVLQVAATEKYD